MQFEPHGLFQRQFARQYASLSNLWTCSEQSHTQLCIIWDKKCWNLWKRRSLHNNGEGGDPNRVFRISPEVQVSFKPTLNCIELKCITDLGKSLLRTRSILWAPGFCGRQSWSYWASREIFSTWPPLCQTLERISSRNASMRRLTSFSIAYKPASSAPCAPSPAGYISAKLSQCQTLWLLTTSESTIELHIIS